VNRFADRGAIAAGWVGVGMAVVVGISFLLVIPIEPIYWLLAPLAGVLIGYYANQRSERTGGPWLRILGNATYAGLVTAATIALLLLAVKGLFFAADNGYRDPGQGGALTCSPGAACVYARYVAQDGGQGRLLSAGVTDVSSFTAFYWNQQLGTAVRLFVVTLGGGLVGGVMFGVTRPRTGSQLAPRET